MEYKIQPQVQQQEMEGFAPGEDFVAPCLICMIAEVTCLRRPSAQAVAFPAEGLEDVIIPNF